MTLYVACVLDGECLASLTELQGLADELGSAAQVTMRWTGKLLSRAATMWPLLPQVPTPLATLFSLGLGFTPVLGDLYDLYSGVTGYDPITGEYLSGGERALAIGAAFLPLMSASNLRVSAKVFQWSDDVRLLFRTGIWGGTIRKIARALPDSVVIGVRGRPVMAALWEGIYLRTGKFVPKPSLKEAREVAWEFFGRDFSRVAEFFGLRKMQDKVGRTFFAHSDIDLQFILSSGRPMMPKAAETFLDTLNESIGIKLLQHTDNYNGLLTRANGATFFRQDKMTHIITSSGYQGSKWGMEAFAQYVSDGQWPWIGRVMGGHHLPSNYPSP